MSPKLNDTNYNTVNISYGLQVTILKDELSCSVKLFKHII